MLWFFKRGPATTMGSHKKNHWICDHDHTSSDPPTLFFRTVILFGYFFWAIFTESAPRPIQSVSRDVRLFVCLSVCLCVCPLPMQCFSRPLIGRQVSEVKELFCPQVNYYLTFTFYRWIEASEVKEIFGPCCCPLNGLLFEYLLNFFYLQVG